VNSFEEEAMPDTIGTAQYYKIQTPDKPGECVCLLGTLRKAGVDLLAFSGFPRGRGAQLDVVPSDLARFKAAAKKGKWKLKGPKTCFVVEGEDRPGAVADLVAPLAGAKINITALMAICAGAGRYGALFWVKPRDVKKAAKVLGVV
jgi:prephenate dehydratase